MRNKLYLSFLIAILQFNSVIAQIALDCSNDSTGLIPLTDLGSGTYGSFSGGLYPAGSNVRPIIHQRNGIKISNRIVPLNNAGEVDYINGEILFIGMGPSVASNAFNTFINSMNDVEWEGTNACLSVKGLFLGGKNLYDMVDTTNNKYWNDLQSRLESRGDSWEKIQLVWMFTHSEIDSFDVDYYVNTSVDQYTTLFQRMADSMQNIKQVYLSGFHYTGYTHESHKRYETILEPKGYWSNLAIKEVIERQINGDAGLSYRSTPKKTPYLSWGPYFWADGKNKRGSDSLMWLCEEFRTDSTGGGFHLNEPGRILEAEMLMNFFNTDPVASVWYLANEKWDSCSSIIEKISLTETVNNSLTIFPNPVRDEINLHVSPSFSGEAKVSIYNSMGLHIYSGTEFIDNDILSIPFNKFPPGVYTLRVKTPLMDLSEQFINF